MKFWITGADGQLGTEWVRFLTQKKIPFLATNSREGDITSNEVVKKHLEQWKPDVVVNCAAYNQVDLAEKESVKAFQVNAWGPRILAEHCHKMNIRLVHYSTDFVFDGLKKGELYVETDVANPLSVYAQSKYVGEQEVLHNPGNFLVFRVSWVFGPGKQNFAFKTLQWANKMDFLQVACDEFSIPTWTKRITELSFLALQKNLSGLYHLTSKGFCSRCEYSTEVLRILNIPKMVYPVSTQMFDLPAKRPYCSPLSSEKLYTELKIQPRLWRDDLKEFLESEKIPQ